MKTKPVFFLLLFLCLFFQTGCQPSGKLAGLVPCAGTLTMDGAPVADANIILVPKGGEGQRTAAGTTDAQGKFQISTLNPGDGVAPGEYVITVTKMEPYGPAPKIVKDEDGNDYDPGRPMKNVLPDSYAHSEKSDLVVTIPASGNKQLDITLNK